jgi:hypothetical protein
MKSLDGAEDEVAGVSKV